MGTEAAPVEHHAPPGLQPLRIKIDQAGSQDELAANIRAALARKLPEVTPGLCVHDGTGIIVGSGPSLPNHLEDIRRERARGRPILACNGAHDFLCENGITPDLFVTVDPRDTIIGNTKHKNDQTIYLLASRCSPNLFEHLEGCNVKVWHSFSYMPECKEFGGRLAIGGGTTSGLRSINVYYVLGFRRVVLYGMDSCLAPDGRTKRFSGELAGKTVEVVVGASGRKFVCNYAMAQQANEFQEYFTHMPEMQIDVMGDGLLAAIVQERRRLKKAA